MKCRNCYGKTRVVQTRKFLDGLYIKRTRECKECGQKFNTYEITGDEFYSLKLGYNMFKGDKNENCKV